MTTYLADAATDTIVIVQIEDAAAARRATRMASVPLLDGIWIGPNDLSLSLGHVGDLAHPDVSSVIDSVTEAILGSTATALCMLVDDEKQARIWRQRGASVLLFSSTALFASRLKHVVDDVRESCAVTALARPLAEGNGSPASTTA